MRPCRRRGLSVAGERGTLYEIPFIVLFVVLFVVIGVGSKSVARGLIGAAATLAVLLGALFAIVLVSESVGALSERPAVRRILDSGLMAAVKAGAWLLFLEAALVLPAVFFAFVIVPYFVQEPAGQLRAVWGVAAAAAGS